ncbi:nuclear transport factor 2 family protein [Patulibacter sp.]|uniref:nuclear transport factor 2 family protein n=1 Tax=Patulibacter sp. TaxID=1912859 RepID=UPI002726EF2D|nr:nuclear transport factor 2 family protein [Patulibacter sp.]MDO9407991.1 nuclear transport factor 2 family protein [Patulibacter sp.]
MSRTSLAAGAVLAVAARAALPRLLRLKFARDVTALNRGDHRGLLSSYADDAVLRFHDGDHRWAGDWVGRDGIDAFLRNLTTAGFQGSIGDVSVSGPPWAMTVMARFDDHVDGPDGERLYENRTVLVLRTRWGKVVEHEDFYADTGEIVALDRRLTALGVAPVPRPRP